MITKTRTNGNRQEWEQANLDHYEERLIHTCGYCQHTGVDVNHINYHHVGGLGEIPFPVCDDTGACIQRVDTRF